MKISEYINTVDKIRPDDNLRDRICRMPEKETIEETPITKHMKRYSARMYWLIPVAAILMVLFGGAIIAQVLRTAPSPDLPGSTSPGNTSVTGRETDILTPVINAFSINVYAADGTVAPETDETVSLLPYESDTLPGIPFTMNSSVYTDSVISIETDKGAIKYAPAPDEAFVTYAAGTICTIKAGDTFYWSPENTDISNAEITITEKRADVFCSYIKMVLTSDPEGSYTAQIATVLSAPKDNGGTLSLSGKIQDGVCLDASIDLVSAGYYFNPEAVGKKYITHLESWNDGRFISAFSDELAGAAIWTQTESDAILHFEEVQGTYQGQPVTFWVNDMANGRPAYYRYRYDNGVDIYIKGNFSQQVEYSTKKERIAEYPSYSLPLFMYSDSGMDGLTKEQKDSLQQDLSFASRTEALDVIMQKLDKLGIRVSSDYTCYAFSNEQFPDTASFYYFEFQQDLNGLPVYRNDWMKEQIDGEYALGTESNTPDIVVQYSENGICNFQIRHIFQSENSSGCEINECTVPDILTAYDKFVELNGDYTVTEVKLVYIPTSSTFTESDCEVTVEPCWAFKVKNNETGKEIDYSKYGGSTEWFYVPYSMAG